MAKLNMIMQATYEPVGASADTSFKTDGRLFASAYNKVKTAKTIINGCKNLLASNSFDSNPDFTKLKDSIMYSGINALTEKIEETKTSLMRLDSEFADDYMRATQEFLMSASDNQNMTEEERMQYNLEMAACQEEYYRNCLYILEKYEESEMLTDEMENELKYLKSLVAQYDIQDKIAGLEPTSEEYINLFKENAEHTKNLIKYNASLSEEDKSKMLGEFETQYQAQLNALQTARANKLKVEEYELELQELYQAKADNSDFWHPFVENEIDESILEMKANIAALDPYNQYAATADELAYLNMNGWERFCENTKTFCASTATGFMSFGEGLMDGAVMLTVGTVGLFNDDVATWTSEFVGISHSNEVYNSWVKSGCLNEVSAYGGWHTAGDAFGQLIGKVGTSFLAPWANAVVSGVQAVGSSSETSFINGEEYGAVFAKGLVSGVGGAFEGYAMSKLNIGVREFAASGALKTIGSTAVTNAKNFGSTLMSKGGIKAAGQSVLNATVNGVKNLPSALGKAGWATLTEADAMVETGCVLVNNIIDSAVTGEWDVGKIVLETGSVFAINYVMNLAMASALDVNNPKVTSSAANIDKSTLTPVEVSQNLTYKDIEYINGLKATGMSEQDALLSLTANKNLDIMISRKSHLQYDTNLNSNTLVDKMGKYFGDGGRDLRNELVDGKSLQEIISELDPAQAKKINEFLDNTIEGRFLKSLTQEELAALNCYTSVYYSRINNALRTGDLSQTLYWTDGEHTIEDIVTKINSAMQKYGGLTNSTTLYRATDVNAFLHQSYKDLFDGVNFNDLDEVYATLKTIEGHDFSDAAFMSTSPGYATSFAHQSRCPIVFEIVAEQGTPGAYINQISDFYNTENEFLLAAGTKLRIVEVLEPNKDMHGLEKIIIKCVVE